MASLNHQYFEPLDEEERNFLVKKERKERRLYLMIYRILLVMSFFFPFICSWYRVTDDAATAFSKSKFILSAGILFFISTFSVYAAYRVFLLKVQKDIKSNTKTVAGHKILRKVFVPLKNTYHFFINSPIKLSIEVNLADFSKYNEGDEVYIEYATNCKEYFGYF